MIGRTYGEQVLDVSYKQIVLCASMEAAPFSMWNERQIAQGFVWRKDSPSFATLVDGSHKISLELRDELLVSKDAVIAVEIPFACLDENMEVTSIGDSKSFQLETGQYQVLYEYFNFGNDLRIRVSFAKPCTGQIRVLRAPTAVPEEFDLTSEIA